jgi:ribosomal protein S12 methylthiotransferase accessory factor
MHRGGHRLIAVDDQEVEATLRVRLRTDRRSVDVRLFDLTTDLPIPVVFIAMRRQAECGPVTCVGAASRLSPRRAVHKCIQEAGQNFPYLRYLLDTERHWQPELDFSNLTSFDRHFLLYLKRPELVAPAFAFLDECQAGVALSEMPDRSTGRVLADLDYCVARLGEAGHEVVVTDITTPDIAAIDLSAVRVIVPGLVPLHADHRRPFLGNRRLHAAPALPGRHPRETSAEGGFNPYPHPFP